MLIKRSVERAIAPRRSANWTGGIKCSPANKNGWRENGKRKKPGAVLGARVSSFWTGDMQECIPARPAGQTGCASRGTRANDARVALNSRLFFRDYYLAVVVRCNVVIAPSRAAARVSADGRE